MSKKSPLEKHQIVGWFASNPVVANLLMIVILGWGTQQMLTIRKEAFPSFSPDSVIVTVPFNGGVPEDVERGVAIKIEEAIQGVDGIDTIKSTSTDTAATVTVEAVEGYPLSKLFENVKVQVDSISTFPEQAERPIITELEAANNVLWVEVMGALSEESLKETARSVRDELLKLPDVEKVETYGDRDYEISIEVSEEKLRFYDLTFDEISEAVSRNSIDLAGGFVRSSRGDISLRARSQAYVATDFQEIPIRTTADGTRIYVSDVAEVRDAFVDQDFISLFGGESSVSLQITTEGNQDIVLASEQAKELIDRYESDFGLPPGVSLTYWKDGSEPIRSRLELLVKNGIQGVVLVLISLALFLNLRLAFWVAIGIPVTMAGALILFPLPGIDVSINMITAFSFIVVLGLIVDDAIVIGESVFSEKQNPTAGDTAVETTLRGVSRVLTPATFGVVTTIAAFYPLTQVSGLLGNVFGQIAVGVIFCLVFSLVESKLILPAHLAHVRVDRVPKNFLSKGIAKVQGHVALILQWFIDRVYRPLLEITVRFRYATLGFFLATFILAVSLVPSGKIRFVFFPSIFTDDVTATLTLEEGLPFEVLEENAIRISEAISKVNDEIRSEIGDNVVRHVQVRATNNTEATISANLTTSESREISTGEIVNLWRKRVGPIAGAKALTFQGTAGPPGDELSIQLESPNLESLRLAADLLKERVATYPGVFDVQDTFSDGRPEIEVSLTEAGEASGFNRASLANGVRAAFYGIEAQRVQRGRDEVKVMVRYPESDRRQIDTLREMRIRSQDGVAIPFEIVAETKFGESLSAIERADFKRIVSVTGSVDKAVTSGDEVISDLEAGFFSELRTAFPDVSVSLRGEAEEQAESLKSLVNGFILSIAMIYILLAIPLGSFVKPLFIMSVIPFGIIGAILGHGIAGISVSILSLFGVLALSGIVVNDSLVLMSRIDSFENEGQSLREAIFKAGPQRFRAILLTTLTTFIGLFPILLETSSQAQFLKPMAVSVAFGVAFATTITLILLPILMIIYDETLNASWNWWRRRLGGEENET